MIQRLHLIQLLMVVILIVISLVPLQLLLLIPVIVDALEPLEPTIVALKSELVNNPPLKNHQLRLVIFLFLHILSP
jgi:hypothetical protein